jgi:Mg2+/Co2+ transporter CorB
MDVKGKVKRKKWLLYADDIKKLYWDVFITFILLLVCVVIPYRLAFVEHENILWRVTYFILDVFFLMDIIVNFNSTFQDK